MSHLFDLSALVGLGLVVLGLWWIYPPLALIVSGGACLSLAVLGAKRWRS